MPTTLIAKLQALGAAATAIATAFQEIINLESQVEAALGNLSTFLDTI